MHDESRAFTSKWADSRSQGSRSRASTRSGSPRSNRATAAAGQLCVCAFDQRHDPLPAEKRQILSKATVMRPLYPVGRTQRTNLLTRSPPRTGFQVPARPGRSQVRLLAAGTWTYEPKPGRTQTDATNGRYCRDEGRPTFTDSAGARTALTLSWRRPREVS